MGRLKGLLTVVGVCLGFFALENHAKTQPGMGGEEIPLSIAWKQGSPSVSGKTITGEGIYTKGGNYNIQGGFVLTAIPVGGGRYFYENKVPANGVWGPISVTVDKAGDYYVFCNGVVKHAVTAVDTYHSSSVVKVTVQ